MHRKFTIVDEITRQYRRFNTVGTQLTVRLLPPPSDTVRPLPPSTDENAIAAPSDTVSSLPPPSNENVSNPISQFLDSVTDLCEYALRNCDDSDIVGISIRNEVSVKDKAIGISFTCKDQLSPDVTLNVLEKVTNLIRVLALWTR